MSRFVIKGTRRMATELAPRFEHVPNHLKFLEMSIRGTLLVRRDRRSLIIIKGFGK
jgi:hypothetical protein